MRWHSQWELTNTTITMGYRTLWQKNASLIFMVFQADHQTRGHNTVVPGEILRFIRHLRQEDETMPGQHQIGVVDRLRHARM
jgi:hypothetical protein